VENNGIVIHVFEPAIIRCFVTFVMYFNHYRSVKSFWHCNEKTGYRGLLYYKPVNWQTTSQIPNHKSLICQKDIHQIKSPNHKSIKC